MNDRELLELAAKAAGLNYTWCEFWETMARPLKDRSGWNHRFVWNPLRDDAAAFRLAVQLNLDVQIDFNEEEAKVYIYGGWVGDGIEEELGELDRYQATRRAIVRAAAEIGRIMP